MHQKKMRKEKILATLNKTNQISMPNHTKKIRFKLYITGDTSENHQAIQSVKKLLSQFNQAHMDLSIIDILKDPLTHTRDKIVATPTLLRVEPEPVIKMLGDFTDHTLMKKLLGLPQGGLCPYPNND